VHADDVLEVLVDVVFYAEFFSDFLRVVVFINSQLFLLPVANFNGDNEQLSCVFAVFCSGEI